jgi:glycosyltransferase involved in cell wall biosynthesis
MLQEHIGGMRQYFHRLFSELLKNDHENIYVFFYFMHNEREFVYLHNERWKDNAILLNSQDDVNLHLDKIDLYFCPFGALWPRPVKVPSVVTLPDIQEKYYPDYFSAEDLFNRKLYYDPSTHIADRVIAISNFTKESIIKHHGISGGKIHVAYLCSDEELNTKTPEPVPNELKLPEKFIFFPANRWKHKDHDGLLKALAILRDHNVPGVNCVFTGHEVSGGYLLSEKVREYGLRDRIQVLSYVSSADMRMIYRKAEMLCFPSVFEGFGMPVLEAMTLGCPVICSNTTSLPEVGGSAVLYFDPNNPEDIADKINSLWNNKELREQLIYKGHQQARLFSASDMAQKHLDTFREAFESYNSVHYYYDKFIYDPLYRFKMRYYRKYKYNLT